MMKNLFVLGYGRSGSTFFDAYLGKTNRFFSLGESISALKRANKACSCGKVLTECEFWDEYFSQKLSAEDHKALKQASRFYSLLLFALGFQKGVMKRVVEIYNEFYEYIGDHTKKRGVVDSSKIPSIVYTLMLHNKKAEAVHLVRNLSGVINSYWKDHKKGIGFVLFGMNIRSFALRVVVVSLQWNFYNFISYLFKVRFGSRYSLVRYENVVQHMGTVENDPSEVLHQCAGNQARKSGFQVIRIDDVKLPIQYQVLSKVFGFPSVAMFPEISVANKDKARVTRTVVQTPGFSVEAR